MICNNCKGTIKPIETLGNKLMGELLVFNCEKCNLHYLGFKSPKTKKLYYVLCTVSE